MTALIWCPFPDEDSASAVASALLDEGLISCANIMPGMQSMFVWQGERGEGREVGVLFKLDHEGLTSAISRIEALHPYETPAILGWKCDAASEATRAWLGGRENGDG